MGSEIEATAQATKAVAETTGKAIDASRDVGGFMRNVFGPALEELGGTWHDRVRYSRLERLMKLERRFEAKRIELGFTGPIKYVEPKIGIPLVEAASLEDDDELLGMFATLLATATAQDREADTRKAFVGILRELAPFDAKVLLALYGCPIPEAAGNFDTVCTNGLPEHHVTPEQQRAGKPGRPRHAVEVSLWNLSRLGMLAPGSGWGGVTSIFTVTRTALGHAFLAATTTEADREAHRPTAFQAPDDTGA